MSEASIVIVDEDADFCRRLDGFLRARLRFPVTVHDYTDPAAVGAHEGRGETAALLISESALKRTAIEGFPRVIVLSEGLGIEAEAPVLRRVHKYRPLDGLLSALTEMVMDAAVISGMSYTGKEGRAVLIGFFTPVSRCLQTTSALTLGQLCAQEKKTLYLCMEPFSGLRELPGDAGGLSDLLYYYDCEPEKLPLHLERTKARLGALDVVPPPESFADMAETGEERWQELFLRLAEESGYEVIVADLSACVRGLFGLLRLFDHVVTIGRRDEISEEKLRRYDRALKRGGFAEINARSIRIMLPVFQKLPADPVRYGEGELAGFWRTAIRAHGLLEGGNERV